MKRRIFIDMDGTLVQWNNVESQDVLYEKGYYENLKPNEDLLMKVKKLIENGEDVYILSSFLHDSKYALAEKNIWLDNFLPELSKDKRIFTNYGDDKSIYIVGGITSNDYLIDDYTKNLNEWKEAGGIGIKYLNGINHTKGTWKGLCINKGTNLELDLNKILNISDYTNEPFNNKYIELSTKFRNAISNYANAIDKSTEELLNAEIELKDIKNELLNERNRLLNLYDVEIIDTWKESEDLAIHYQIKFKDGRKLYDGYQYIEMPESYTPDKLINRVLSFDIQNKKDLVLAPEEIKFLVNTVLGVDYDGYVRLYEEDLTDYFDVSDIDLPGKIDEIKNKLKELKLENYIDIHVTDSYPKKINYIDIDPTLVSEFNYSNDGKYSRTINFEINDKPVACNLVFNESLGGWAVSGYTLNDNQTLTQDEMALLQGKLLHEITNISSEMAINNDEINNDIDIADDIF